MAEHVCKAEFNKSKKRIQIVKKYFDDGPLNTNERLHQKKDLNVNFSTYI